MNQNLQVKKSLDNVTKFLRNIPEEFLKQIL